MCENIEIRFVLILLTSCVFAFVSTCAIDTIVGWYRKRKFQKNLIRLFRKKGQDIIFY